MIQTSYHRENGGTLGMVALIINPIYTLYSGIYMFLVKEFGFFVKERIPSLKLTGRHGFFLHHFDGIYQEIWGFSMAMLV